MVRPLSSSKSRLRVDIRIFILAGRKASSLAPWLDMTQLATEAAGGWPDDVWAPSAIPHNDKFASPKELSREGIKGIVAAFVAAARRALKVGFGSYLQLMTYILPCH